MKKIRENEQYVYGKSTLYEYYGDWLVDVRSNNDGTREAYLINKNCNIEMSMFMLEPGFDDWMVMEILDNITKDYIELYKLLYEDEYTHVEKGFVRRGNYKTITYVYYIDWMIDIVTIGRNREAYLYNRGCDVKMLMVSRRETDLDEFLQTVEDSIDSYIEQYKERYM